MAEKQEKLSPVEGFKRESNYLRGDIASELVDENDGFGKASVQLLKNHGTYEQDDRDRRKEAKQAGVGRFTSFMVRTKIPGGRLTSEQLLAEIDMCDELGNQTLRVTTRQGLQLHGIVKSDLPATIRRINEIQLTTLAACGDVCRNVMASPAPYRNRIYDTVQAVAQEVSDAFTPRTRAYHEIWLTNGTDPDAESTLVAGGAPEPECEPLYGEVYLPRKFKVAVALPDDNSIDLLSNDLGYLAIPENGEVVGYNIYVGGGMGTTPSAKKTFPALGKALCYVPASEAVAIGAAVMKVQRDHGNRADRKVARMKYLIADWGMERFAAAVAEHYGQPLTPPRDVPIAEAGDDLGWNAQGDGKFFYGLYVENGRIKDEGNYRLKAALREICRTVAPPIRLTAHQNIIFCDLVEADRKTIADILRAHGVPTTEQRSAVRRLSMACPAMPTCGLAVAESERAHPEIMDGIQSLLDGLGLGDTVFATHMTGCPNGCARPYSSDLGIVGKTGGKYTLFVGGNVLGTRLSFIYKDLVPQEEIAPTLRPLLERYRDERLSDERFGDYCDRVGPQGLAAEAELRAVEEEEIRDRERREAEVAS